MAPVKRGLLRDPFGGIQQLLTQSLSGQHIIVLIAFKLAYGNHSKNIIVVLYTTVL